MKTTRKQLNKLQLIFFALIALGIYCYIVWEVFLPALGQYSLVRRLVSFGFITFCFFLLGVVFSKKPSRG